MLCYEYISINLFRHHEWQGLSDIVCYIVVQVVFQDTGQTGSMETMCIHSMASASVYRKADVDTRRL